LFLASFSVTGKPTAGNNTEDEGRAMAKMEDETSFDYHVKLART
jgi:hypothetical protein